MKTISLKAVPNQEVSFNSGGISYDLRLHLFRDVLYANLSVNGDVVVCGIRCVPFEWMIPDGLAQNLNGNLRFETIMDRYPDYESFQSGTCKLVYYASDEIDELRTSSDD